MDLVLHQVNFGYGQSPLITNLNLNLRKGEFVGIIGPNGAGKSTLLRLLNRLLIPMRGEIVLEGRPLNQFSLAELAKKIAFIPQEPEYFPFLAKEIVMMGKRPYVSRFYQETSQDWEEAYQAMAETGVQHLADQSVDKLSGGERQRVMLARIFLQNTAIFLLDEPTNHLDVEHQVIIGRLLQQKARAGRLCVAVMHDLNLASTYCDRLILLVNGEIVAEGRPNEVLIPEILSHAYSVELHRTIHPITGRPIIIP